MTVDLQVKFEDFNSKEEFTVLEMDRHYDVFFSVPGLKKHKPCIDWRLKTIKISSSRVVEILGGNELTFTMYWKKRSGAQQSYDAEFDPHFIGICHAIDIPQVRKYTKLHGVTAGGRSESVSSSMWCPELTT
ncbi:hypothetical protein Plhal710r2_c014g0062351 [Plasmopara halstedii]